MEAKSQRDCALLLLNAAIHALDQERDTKGTKPVKGMFDAVSALLTTTRVRLVPIHVCHLPANFA